MMSSVFFILALICGVPAARGISMDFECFQAAFPNYIYNTTIKNSTFDIRIEHSGPLFDIGDWFDNGTVHTIREGEVYKYHTTAKAMSEICTMVDAFHGDWCEGAMNEIGEIQRFLVVGFDGENLLMAMNKMVVTVTETGASSKWSGCESKKMTAVQDMNAVEFTYIQWDTSAITGDFPEWWSPDGKLRVSGGSETTTTTTTATTAPTASTTTTAITTEGPGCLGVPLKFSLASDTFPESRSLK